MVTRARLVVSAASLALLCAACRQPSGGRTAVQARQRPTPAAPTAPVVVQEPGIDPAPLLARDATTAMALGAGPLQVVAVAASMEGDRLGGFVSLARDTCMLAFARSTPGIDDLDIVVFDDAGTPLAADQATDPRPAVMLCPPHPARVYVTGRVAAGHGFVGLAVQAVPAASAAKLAAVFGARIAQKEEVFAQAWPGLDNLIARRRRALGGHWEELRKAAVSVHPRAPVYVSTPLPASRCLDVMVVPNEETANLEVTVSDETGRELARAPNVGKDRVALVCSPVETTLSVGVRPHDGHGLVAVVMSRSAAGDQSELSTRPDAVRASPMGPLDKVRDRISGPLSRAGYDAKTDLAAGNVEPGRAVAHVVDLQPGCTRIDVLAGAPASGVTALLWDGSNELIASGDGGEQLTLFGCVATAQKASLQITALGRPGPYAVELRREKAPPPDLMHHPLAASRALGRANAAGRITTMQSLNDVRRIDLDETRRVAMDATVAVGTCMNVVAATQPGASGITLSAQEEGSGAIVETSHGHTVTQLSVCARARAMKIKIHASVDAGKAEGVAVRFVSTFEKP
jgi:hypothetical protein